MMKQTVTPDKMSKNEFESFVDHFEMSEEEEKEYDEITKSISVLFNVTQGDVNEMEMEDLSLSKQAFDYLNFQTYKFITKSYGKSKFEKLLAQRGGDSGSLVRQRIFWIAGKEFLVFCIQIEKSKKLLTIEKNELRICDGGVFH